MTACLSAQPSAVETEAMDSPLLDYAALSEALSLTELNGILEKGMSFTVFAPPDAAFRRLEEQGMDLLHPDNRKQLKALLAYHIVAGELTASRILKALCRGEGAAMFTTVQGEPLIATIEGVDIILTDCFGNRARITKADNGADHLVFHEIDKVVMPGVPSP